MTRALAMVPSHDAVAVSSAIETALAGDGPAVLAHPGSPTGLPEIVEQRVAVVVETSGSTGRPKRVALSADALLASAAASDTQLGGPGQWLLALPAHYIAGINVIVRSLASGTVPVVMPAEHFTAEGFVAAAEALGAPRRFTSLVPAQLARLLAEEAALETLRRFDRILIGGQAMPTSLLALALESGLNVTRTYGASETSGGCIWDGVPIGDTTVRIVEERVEIAGSVLAEGYLEDPERTAQAFHEADSRRWFRTDDTGRMVDGVLEVTGRADDVIVSGGVKVSLSEVELAVRGMPGLEDAVVVAAPHPEWGEAPVVVATAAPPLTDIRLAVAAALGAAASPARVVIVDAIPALPSGKPDRLAAAALALK